MNVYVLLEERDQPGFTDNYGETAWPSSAILGVYESKDRAEYELNLLNAEQQKAVEEQDADPISYYIEERPVLQ